MNENIYEEIREMAKSLRISITPQEVAHFMTEKKYTEENISAIREFLGYIKEKRHERRVSMLMTMSRMPSREPKTFDNFDFGRISGKNADGLKNLATLSTLYSHRNLAFIGPPGVGKTHLAMAYGRECYLKEYKSYFLKATELNQKFTESRRIGKEASVVNSLVNHSCLIIDEIGRCVFDRENTRLFFDVVDRRVNKEVPSNMIFTSNITPDKWNEFFNEDEALLCALDRIFDDALVFMMKGTSYRGKKCETYSITAGNLSQGTK